ncbi:MAG: SUMF1/EgtB/PvdO family nonheme iron enzyme [Acidobacteria bacterium]|nr:SUMF1/EgtB/PvdO family nonheme iron enzyme [Acidobacteriota bacterium]
MATTGQAQRSRAVTLLGDFFATQDLRSRASLFQAAFDGLSPNPCRQIDFTGPAAPFAAAAVDQLLRYGRAGRGKHCLSLLLAEIRAIVGPQSNPDYYDLEREFDSLCALPTRDEEQRYLARLIDEIEAIARRYSPLQGIARSMQDRQARSLLRLWKNEPDLDLVLRHTPRRRDLPECRPEDRRDYDDILTAFDGVRRAALLGAPGSGKSTTLRKLALELATRAQQDQQAPLPFLAPMGAWRGDEPLQDFLSATSPEIGWAVQALSQANRLVLLLDGLNEVPTAKRAAKASYVQKLQDKLPSAAPIIVSCRREDYVGDLDLGLDTLTLEPLSPQRIRSAVHHWVAQAGQPAETADRFFWQLAGDERLAGVLEKWLAAGASEDDFWTAQDPSWERFGGWEYRALWRRQVRDNPRSLVKLAANPFMLTMLFKVWADEEGKLPQNRGDLFGRFINGLLQREGLLARNAASGEWRVGPQGERLLTGLAELAWRMQTDRINAGEDENASFGVMTVASRETALETLGGDTLLKKAQDATILEGTEDLRFRHQLLQEYFTAQALQTRLEQTSAAELWPADRWWRRSGWEEAAVLLAGFHSDDCTPVIRWLRDAQPETAAQCIQESGAGIRNRAELLAELQAAWLARLTDTKREPQPEARAAIGRALGRLNLDSRKGVGLTAEGLPDIDWVEIPSGEFIYQEGERRQIDAFQIARYPVTNAQFQAFVDAPDGYRQDRWWKGLTKPDRNLRQPQWGESNHPRETVSWWQAMAFCAWLGHKLRRDIALPTEWQWERAARGVDGRIYPWGDEYRTGFANIDETWGEVGSHNLGRTSAVGIYPDGASPDRVLDLSGNVWEWCRNEYDKPDRIQERGTESRVLRGGSWINYQAGARADSRYLNHPASRDGLIGFRVVCSSPIR